MCVKVKKFAYIFFFGAKLKGMSALDNKLECAEEGIRRRRVGRNTNDTVECRLHRTGRNAKGLNQERLHSSGNHDGHKENLDILAQGSVLGWRETFSDQIIEASGGHRNGFSTPRSNGTPKIQDARLNIADLGVL